MRGGCICGAVRFEAEPRAREIHACHCQTCRRWTGAALLGVSVLPDDVRFEGAEHIRTYQSSEWAERAWCDRCGTTLYYHLTADGFGPKTYEMALGLFDEPDGLPLTKEIYIDRKPDGFAFAGEHERQTKAEVEAGFGGEGAT
jgi:hypothetical protein